MGVELKLVGATLEELQPDGTVVETNELTGERKTIDRVESDYWAARARGDIVGLSLDEYRTRHG